MYSFLHRFLLALLVIYKMNFMLVKTQPVKKCEKKVYIKCQRCPIKDTIDGFQNCSFCLKSVCMVCFDEDYDLCSKCSYRNKWYPVESHPIQV